MAVNINKESKPFVKEKKYSKLPCRWSETLHFPDHSRPADIRHMNQCACLFPSNRQSPLHPVYLLHQSNNLSSTVVVGKRHGIIKWKKLQRLKLFLIVCHATVGTKKELNVWEPILNIDKEDLCAYCILS